MRAACCEATVLRNESHCLPDIRLLTVRSGLTGTTPPTPGQFFTLRAWGADEAPFLSRPISVHQLEPGQPAPLSFCIRWWARALDKDCPAQDAGYLPAHRPHGQRL